MFKKLGLMERSGRSGLALEVDAKLSREPKVRHCFTGKCYNHVDNQKIKKIYSLFLLVV